MSTLDELLKRFGEDYHDDIENCDGSHNVSLTNAKASLIEYIEGIIGEDDELPTNTVDWDWEIDRNQLRAEQRAKLKEQL